MAFFRLMLIACFGVVASVALAAERGWLEERDRMHAHIAPERHVQSLGQIEAVDIEQGTVTISHLRLESPDKSIWMPAMRMVFHATNRAILMELNPGDRVTFEALRLGNAVMVTKLGKLP